VREYDYAVLANGVGVVGAPNRAVVDVIKK
jgi:hypothetical protein